MLRKMIESKKHFMMRPSLLTKSSERKLDIATREVTKLSISRISAKRAYESAAEQYKAKEKSVEEAEYIASPRTM